MTIDKNAFYILGAERQGATSAALAYPERQFVGITSQPVVDGWDLPNLKIIGASKVDLKDLPKTQSIYLCSRWLHLMGDDNLATLSSVFEKLRPVFGKHLLPITQTPPSGRWIAKGNRWHRPNFIAFGEGNKDLPVNCESGLVYQERVEGKTLLTTGRRWADGRVSLGNFEIFREAFAAEEAVTAAEVVARPELEEKTRAALETLAHVGFFSFNWIVREHELFLTSFRPIAKGLFQSLRKSGVNLLQPPTNTSEIAKPGVRMISEIHYSSYTRIEP